MTFSSRQSAMLERSRTRFGESATLRRYTFGNPAYKTGTPPTETLAESATVLIVRTKTFEGLDAAGAGGRVAVDRFTAWVLAADVAWTPAPDDTRLVFNGVTYKIAAVEAENDGLAWRMRMERLGSEE
jgi:hypothetical protein